MKTEDNVNELFRRYRESKDVRIRNEIAEKYLYVADILAKKFAGRGVEFDDLKQVASLALLRGIDRFDPELGMKFTTFITPTIAGEIKNYFRDKSRIVKLPRRLNEIGRAVKRFTEQYLSEQGKKPSVTEISAALSLSEEDVLEALEIGGTLSLDSATEEENGSLYAVLPEREEAYESLETKDALRAAMKDFSQIERDVIKYRYADELSQSETAKLLGVSQMFVSRMERKLLARLKDNLKEGI